MDFKMLFSDILKGYKRLLVFMAWTVVCAALIWGMLSAVLVLAGRIPFMWFDIPCWLLLLTAVAGAIGSYC